jgi:hypothetical protein
MTASARGRAVSFARMVRAAQWWNYKLLTNTGTPTLEEAVARAAAFLRERLRSGSYGRGRQRWDAQVPGRQRTHFCRLVDHGGDDRAAR